MRSFDQSSTFERKKSYRRRTSRGGCRLDITMSTAVAGWTARALATCVGRCNPIPRLSRVAPSSATITQQIAQHQRGARSSELWRARQSATASPTPFALSPSPSRRLVHTGDPYTPADRDKAVKMAGPLGLVAGLFGSCVGEGVPMSSSTTFFF